MAGTTKRPTGSDSTQGRDDPLQSHFEYGSTRGRWKDRDDSGFAITSVNIPDRLDTQEVRNRAEADSTLPKVGRFHREDLMRVARWAVALLALATAVWWGVRVAVPLREAISPAGVASHLGQALGVPVSVGNTTLQFSPSPRLVLTDTFVQSGYRLPEVSVLFNWGDAVRGLQTAHWVLGEARVAPIEITGEQALALLDSVRAAGRLPAALSTIRFESISFADLVLLPGRYEAVIRRAGGPREFGTVALRRLDVAGRVEIEISPAPTAAEGARFALFASKWPAVVGPGIVWDQATAQGEFRADLIKADSFSVGAKFGNVSGSATVTKVGDVWQVGGATRFPDLNFGELIRFAAGQKGAEGAEAGLPLRGVGKLELTLGGSGGSVAEALQHATAQGSGTAPGAVFGGLNLGVAATQGGAAQAGGVTRLTDLGFDVLAARGGLTVRAIKGRSGSMWVTGGFTVDPALNLIGALRPEVVSPRGTAGATIRLGGTISAPTYR